MGWLSPTTHGLCSHVGMVGPEWQLAYLFLSPTGPYKNHVVCHHIIRLPQKRCGTAGNTTHTQISHPR